MRKAGWLGWFWFYVILMIVGYLMLNPVYTYFKYDL